MRFIDDNQIPACGDQVTDTFLVVPFESFPAPASASFDRFDGIDRANHLIEPSPNVVITNEMPIGREVAGREKLKLLVEMGPHFLDPLCDKPSGSHDQHPCDQASQLEFSND